MLIIIHNNHCSWTKGSENREIFVSIQFHQIRFILKCFDDQNKCKMNGRNTIIQPTITQCEPAIRHEDLDRLNGEKATNVSINKIQRKKHISARSQQTKNSIYVRLT